LSFDLQPDLSQRQLCCMGRALGRVVSMEFVVELGERGFRPDLISNCLSTLRMEVESLVSTFDRINDGRVSEDNLEGAAWQDFLLPA